MTEQKYSDRLAKSDTTRSIEETQIPSCDDSPKERVLRSMRMVNYRKEGRNVHYSLADSQAIELYRSLDRVTL